MENNLVITGIPRSGTSYVCSLLNRVKNTVIVNEPEEALLYLHNNSSTTLADFYQNTRNKILKGAPIKNKVVNGKYTEDTNENDRRSYYVPEVLDESFVFGSKNTFVYLVCMEKIRKQLSSSVFLACVRHPYDVIASWKKVKFAHLKDANPGFFIDYANNQERRMLTAIAAVRDIESRYALLWDFLAQCIIRDIDKLVLLKYEQLVVNPEMCVTAIYRAMGRPNQEIPGMPASRARSDRSALSAEEMQAIQKYCAGSASVFGYEL